MGPEGSGCGQPGGSQGGGGVSLLTFMTLMLMHNINIIKILEREKELSKRCVWGNPGFCFPECALDPRALCPSCLSTVPLGRV